MKKLSRIFLLTLVLVLAFSLYLVPASAQTKYFSEDFKGDEVGSYPSSFIPFYPGAIQEVTSDYGSNAFIIGNESNGLTFHGANIAIDPNALKVTVSFKMQTIGNGMTAYAFGHNMNAIQIQFAGGTIIASSGDTDFVPVGTYSNDTWIRVITKLNVANGTYDLIVNDELLADNYPTSAQPLPAPFSIGTMGENNAAIFDNISVKGDTKRK